jgi:hypothetical protein
MDGRDDGDGRCPSSTFTRSAKIRWHTSGTMREAARRVKMRCMAPWTVVYTWHHRGQVRDCLPALRSRVMSGTPSRQGCAHPPTRTNTTWPHSKADGESNFIGARQPALTRFEPIHDAPGRQRANLPALPRPGQPAACFLVSPLPGTQVNLLFEKRIQFITMVGSLCLVSWLRESTVAHVQAC